MNVLVLIAYGAIVLSSVPSVWGHGYIIDPAPTWKDGYAVNGWGSSIDSNMWGAIDNSVYGYGTSATVAFFEAQFNSSGYNSLGQFIDTNQVLYSDSIDEQCGYTVYDASARQTMPSSNLTHTGFTHPGPCEIWCDDTKVLLDYNLYTDCVWLEHGSGSGSAPSSVTETVSSNVATAPPTTSSGSTTTATTAYPDTTSSSTTSTTTSSTTAAGSSPSSTAASSDSSTAEEASTAAEALTADKEDASVAGEASTSSETAATSSDSVASTSSSTASSDSTSASRSTSSKCNRCMRRD
ncbi:unnamed protein product [Phytophthora fragariaefolia]|uniref:Unnamed protein product n=1 Tax=Phytophthora fragariaefolia TaxID=1490495 RepID=A0A9W7D959_9STRA|nr:unnamed protein product [Phytophthora fragariaefolia]